ncbi:MAG: hypothetical protein WBM00_10410 [Solirubrobacterales bacterium]
MATEKSKASKATKATSAKPKAQAKAAAPAPASRKDHARSVAESVVDLPVGVVLEVSDRLGDLVEPFTDRPGAEKQLKAYRTQLRRTVKRTERRGSTARRKATTEAKRTRTRVEREARKRQRTVQTTLKRNRSEVEQRVRKAIDEQTSRAQNLVDQVSEQLSTLR